MKNKSINWDNKAKFYSKYHEKLNNFQEEIFAFIKSCGINFCDKNILDVGCGTGFYTIHLAKYAKEVVGVDFSKNMLKYLNKDVQKLNLTNIKTFQSSWQSFIIEKYYDIAFCTMSGAINDEDDIIKFTNSAKQRILLAWAGKRQSSILGHFFEKLNYEYKAPNGAAKLQNFLEKHNLAYQTKQIHEQREKIRSFHECFEDVKWHLSINNVTFDEKEIFKELEKMFHDKQIKEYIKSKMQIFIF